MGDPHIQNIYGEKWIEKAKDFTLFSNELGFAVTADTFGQYFMGQVNFGDQVIKSSDCKKTGKIAGKFQHQDSKYVVSMEIFCAKPKDTAKFGNDFHLDIQTLDIHTFTSVEDTKAAGLCMLHHKPDDGSSANDIVKFKDNAGPVCTCTAACQVQGDPHLTSFNNYKELLKEETLNLYNAEGFSIVANVNSQKYIHHIDVNGVKQFDLTECTMRLGQNEKKLGDFKYNVGTSGFVNGVVNCAKESYGKNKGTKFLNFYITKTDSGKASDFKTMEAMTHSSGACTLDKHVN